MRGKMTISMETGSIKHLVKNDVKFPVLFNLIGEISYNLTSDYYRFIIETIIGQMLSNKVADIITLRLKKLCDSGKIDVNSINALNFNDLLSIGISRKKAQCIIDFTKYYKNNNFNKRCLYKLSDDEIIKEITSIKGLGIWSAKMFLLFVLGRENILPHEDTAYLQAFLWYNEMTSLPSKSEIIQISNKWTPYNSIVARYLYKALDNGFTKSPFNSYKFTRKREIKK